MRNTLIFDIDWPPEPAHDGGPRRIVRGHRRWSGQTIFAARDANQAKPVKDWSFIGLAVTVSETKCGRRQLRVQAATSRV
jgi:hypothetical protein